MNSENNQNNSMRNLFGQSFYGNTPNKPADNIFGQQALPNTTNPFGQNTTSSFPSTNQFQPTSPFGAQTNTQPFGGISTPQQQPNTLFGASTGQQNQTYPFGSTFKPSFTPTSFGQPQTQTQQSTFQPTSFGSTTFGNQQNNSMFSGVFNSNKPTPQVGSSTGWSTGNTNSQPMFSTKKGTGNPPYTKSRKRDEHGIVMEMHHILAMDEYKDKSLEELRKEDYDAGKKPSNNQGIPQTSSSFKPFTPSPSFTPSNQSFNFGSQTTTTTPFTSSQPSTAFPSTAPTQTTSPSPFSQFTSSATTTPVPTTFPSTHPVITQPPPVSPSPNAFSSIPTRPMFTNMSTPTMPTSTPNFQPQTQMQPGATVDTNDPFLIKNLRFEKVTPKKMTLKNVFPTERIFKEKKENPKISLSIRNYGYAEEDKPYTIPPLYEISHLDEIDNLTLVIPGKCKIEFLEPISVYALEDLPEKICMYEDDIEMTDAPGEGINQRARVTMTGYFPYENKKYNEEEYNISQEKFYYKLQNTENRTFIDYIKETGTYVYEVENF
ncbi:Nucleoporin 2 family protein [Spraguea lophii 42_110]|uniref:Nucleoporin 2 family protein n=1 Tax=Spraguea lophii (strain 42_110) TaxID=1358809 RepID=S7XVG6_SPRLO|nr:Nucleoporin 2 family protein [Spraguea lophii 42_110]